MALKTLTEFSGVLLRQAAEIRSRVLSQAKAKAKEAAGPDGDGPPAPIAEEATPTNDEDEDEDEDTRESKEHESARHHSSAKPSPDHPAAAESSEEKAPLLPPASDSPADPNSDEARAAEKSAQNITITAADPNSDEARAAEKSAQNITINAADTNSDEARAAEKSAQTINAADTNSDEARAAEKAQIMTAIEQNMAISADRLERFVEALEAVGKNAANVRLVRVYQGETAPPHAKSFGEFHYVIDKVSQASKKRDRRPRRGADNERERGRNRDSQKTGSSSPSERNGPRERSGPKTRNSDVPSSGIGWSLSRAPREYNDKRDRKKPRRQGPAKRKPRSGSGARSGLRADPAQNSTGDTNPEERKKSRHKPRRPNHNQQYKQNAEEAKKTPLPPPSPKAEELPQKSAIDDPPSPTADSTQIQSSPDVEGNTI